MIISQGAWFSSKENGGYKMLGYNLQCFFTNKVEEQNFDSPSYKGFDGLQYHLTRPFRPPLALSSRKRTIWGSL
jgi:hypothetical protein